MSGDLVILVGRRAQARYADPEQWRALIRDEVIGRGDTVAARRGDETVWLPAAEVPELRALFDELEGVASPTAAPASLPAPTSGRTPPVPVALPPPLPPVAEKKQSKSSRTKDAPPDLPVYIEPVVASRSEDAGAAVPVTAAPAIAESAAPTTGDDARSPLGPRPTKKGAPWPLVILGVAALIAILIFAQIDQTPPVDTETGEVAEAAETVIVHATRETRVRSEPQGSAALMGDLQRGASLSGTWVTGGDGETAWLRITDGPFRGGYAWGPNLAGDVRPRMETAVDAELTLLQDSELRAAPNAGSELLEPMSAGGAVLVAGQVEGGWIEVLRKSGGVAYLPASAFESPEPTLDVQVVEAAPEPSRDATAAEATVADPVALGPIARPVWVRQPSDAERFGLMPDRALSAGVSGGAEMTCVADRRGRLADCRLTAESPRGYGFGDATLALSPFFQLRSTDEAGQPVTGRRIGIPVAYDISTEE